MYSQSKLLTIAIFASAAAGWTGSGIAAPLPPIAAIAAPFAATAPEMQADEIASAALAPNLQRQLVAYSTNAAPGTVIIDTGNTYLYFVLGEGRAIRYGIGVGREGFTWSGVEHVTRKAEWPDWHPPAEMIARQHISPGLPPAAKATRSAPAPFISARPSTGFTALTRRRRSGPTYRVAASACSMRM